MPSAFSQRDPMHLGGRASRHQQADAQDDRETSGQRGRERELAGPVEPQQDECERQEHGQQQLNPRHRVPHGPNPTREIAEAVGVAPSTALERTRGLRERGIIRGAVLDVNLAAIGRGVQALIAVRIRPPNRRFIDAFRMWITEQPETIGVFVVTGSEDFLIHVAVRDNQDLYAFVTDRLTLRSEVADVRTSVVYEHLHNTQILPR